MKCNRIFSARADAQSQKYPKHYAVAQLINFESDEFHSATAKTVQDVQKLIEAGF